MLLHVLVFYISIFDFVQKCALCIRGPQKMPSALHAASNFPKDQHFALLLLPGISR